MTLPLDPKDFEKHNLVLRDGKLSTRKGLVSVATPTAGTVFVAGFSVESPFTSEVWFYLVEQSTTTMECTLRVYTEEFFQVFALTLGPCAPDPWITYATALNQVMINSPALSGPLYGLVGGGLIQAVKQDSENPDTTAIDIPQGIIATFGDRMPIASGSVVYFNDPDLDPRTYVAENALSLPGTIYDMLQGPDGALYVFTSRDTYVIPQDALGHGQLVQAFVSTITGLTPSQSGNACASNGVVACLAEDGLVLVSDGQRRVPLDTYEGKRYWSIPVECRDWRAARLYPTSTGFLVSFGARRNHALLVDVRNNFRSFLWSTQSAINAMGVLRGRDGEDLYVLRDRVVLPQGNLDWDSQTTRGVACGRVQLPADESGVLRAITIAANNVGQSTYSFVDGDTGTVTTPAKTADFVIGTDAFSAATGTLTGRQKRTVRHMCKASVAEIQIEIALEGGNRRLEVGDLELRGQGRKRRDAR